MSLSSSTSQLSTQPTRGSLATDTAWLNAFREHLASVDIPQSGGEVWKPASADSIKVIYAGELRGVRVALVEAPYRWGGL